MIIVLHGDHVEASREELVGLKAKANGKEIRQVEGRGLDETTLTQALESSSLFGGGTLVIFTNVLKLLGRKSKHVETLCRNIANNAVHQDIVLWEDKEIAPSILKLLGSSATIRVFKLPTVIFQFLDALSPGNAKKLLVLYEQTTHVHAPELVFAMLVKRVRQLLMLRDDVAPEGLQAWQASRLTTQAKAFSMEQLLSLYRQALSIEYAIKTGTTPFTLPQLTRQLLL